MPRRERRLTKRERKALKPTKSPASKFEAEVRARAAEGSPGAEVFMDGVPGMRKLSDVLIEWGEPVVGPLLDAPIDAFRTALAFVGLVWTLATESRGKSSEEVVDALFADMVARGLPPPVDAHDVFVALVESRRRDYGDDPRVVLKTEAWDDGPNREVRVASGIAKRTT